MKTATKKKFDALKMKRELQAKLQKKMRRLGESEFYRQQKEWLRNSNDPMAVMWREMQKMQSK